MRVFLLMRQLVSSVPYQMQLQFADFGQAETLKFAEKHAVKAYEKEQTKLANKRKREEQKEENIRITKAKYTEAIQNPVCVRYPFVRMS